MAVPVVRPHSHRRRPRPGKDRPDLSLVRHSPKRAAGRTPYPQNSSTLHFPPSRQPPQQQSTLPPSPTLILLFRLRTNELATGIQKEPPPHLLQTSAIPMSETHPHPPILSPANRPTQVAWRSRSRLQNTG
ncbi:hypothetical protein RB213_006057 [Colletotrichum asianum]